MWVPNFVFHFHLPVISNAYYLHPLSSSKNDAFITITTYLTLSSWTRTSEHVRCEIVYILVKGTQCISITVLQCWTRAGGSAAWLLPLYNIVNINNLYILEYCVVRYYWHRTGLNIFTKDQTDGFIFFFFFLYTVPTGQVI